MASKRTLDLYDEIAFGKHKGYDVAYILKSDPLYIKWIYDNEVANLTDAAIVALRKTGVMTKKTGNVELNQRNLTLRTSDVLNFGKYKGKSIADLLQTSPRYIEWLYSVGKYAFEHHILTELKQRGYL